MTITCPQNTVQSSCDSSLPQDSLATRLSAARRQTTNDRLQTERLDNNSSKTLVVHAGLQRDMLRDPVTQLVLLLEYIGLSVQ